VPAPQKAISERQAKHLKRLNAMWRTRAGQFKLGSPAWNLKHRYLPRNKNRMPLDFCPDCKTNLRIVYYARCKPCGYKHRRDSAQLRKCKDGYLYAEGGKNPRPVHTVKAERALGRKLRKGENVHHVNMQKDDNRNCNLLICSPSYHKRLHYAYERQFAKRFSYVPSSV